MTRLEQVPPDLVKDDRVWALVLPYLEKAADRIEGNSVEADRKYIAEGMKQLWVVLVDTPEQPNKVAAAGITSLKRHDDGLLVCFIELLGGEEMKLWFELKATIEDWARKENRQKVRFWARKGWLKKLPDYRIAAYLMEKDL